MELILISSRGATVKAVLSRREAFFFKRVDNYYAKSIQGRCIWEDGGGYKVLNKKIVSYLDECLEAHMLANAVTQLED